MVVVNERLRRHLVVDVVYSEHNRLELIQVALTVGDVVGSVKLLTL
jgi:hypothetical protein